MKPLTPEQRVLEVQIIIERYDGETDSYGLACDLIDYFNANTAEDEGDIAKRLIDEWESDERYLDELGEPTYCFRHWYDNLRTANTAEDENKCKDCKHYSPGDYDIEVWCEFHNNNFESLFSCSNWLQQEDE